MITEKDIGRRVVINGMVDGFEFVNEPGTLCSIEDEYTPFGICFDRHIGDDMHSCNGYCTTDNGWYVKEENIEFVDEEKPSIDDIDPYSSLDNVLKDALAQADSGKGAIRHANNNNYEDQVICVVQRLLKGHPFGGHAYQIIKKTIESGRLLKIKGKEAAYQEMLGAINYASAMCILIKEEE